MRSHDGRRRGRQAYFNAEGQAAMVISESILMGLIEHGVLTKAQLIDAIDTAILAKTADGSRGPRCGGLAVRGRAAHRSPDQPRILPRLEDGRSGSSLIGPPWNGVLVRNRFHRYRLDLC